jgi:hypothetical protein
LLQEIIGPAAAATATGPRKTTNQRSRGFNKVRVPTQEYLDRLDDIANWKDRLRKKIARELWHPEGWPPAYDELREEIDNFKIACRCLMVRP